MAIHFSHINQVAPESQTASGLSQDDRLKAVLTGLCGLSPLHLTDDEINQLRTMLQDPTIWKQHLECEAIQETLTHIANATIHQNSTLW